MLRTDLNGHGTITRIGGLMSYPTTEEFEYDDNEGIVNYARKVIDEIESFLQSLSGQLSLFEMA